MTAKNGTVTVKGAPPILDESNFSENDHCSGGSSGGYVKIKAYKVRNVSFSDFGSDF